MRFGGVSYLNARPLLEGLEPLVVDDPAGLTLRFERGEVDVALLPVAVGETAGLTRVGSLGIAAHGPVDSVLMLELLADRQPYLTTAPSGIRPIST